MKKKKRGLCQLGGRRGFCLLIFIVLVGLGFVSFVSATDYYVNATTGSDASNGLTPATAWKTISEVNGESFSPGDNVYFERGETWREQLTVPSSGNSTDQITFGAYGSGEKPIISGADLVTGWVNLNSGLDFDKCQNIIISSAVSSTLSDFPVYINITYDSDMLTDFSDLRFYDTECLDTGNELDYEIENYTDIKADVWVKIPSLTSSGKTISMYYKNNTAVSSGENSTGVWDDNYVMVQHLQETDIDDGAGDIKDSTSYSNNGTTANMDTDDQVAGQVDGSFEFDGDDDYVEVPYDSNLNPQVFTISAWINKKITKKQLISIRSGWYYWGIDAEDKMFFQRGGDDWATVNTWQTTSSNTWHHITVTRNSTGDVTLWMDGAILPLWTGSHLDDMSSSNALVIGSDLIDSYFNGTIDEVRISNTIRSADWINQTYQLIANQGTYISFGAEVNYIWNISLTTEPNQVFFNGTRGTEVALSQLDAVNEWNWTSNILYVYSTSNPDTTYTNPGIEASQRSNSIEIAGRSYINIENLALLYANEYSGVTVWHIGTTPNNHITIDNCTAAYNYQNGLWVSGGEDDDINFNITFKNCEVHHNAGNGIDSNHVDHLLIENNYVHHNNLLDDEYHTFLAGIKVYGADVHVSNITITGNEVSDNGVPGATVTGHGIWIDTVSGGTNIVKNNLAYNNVLSGYYIEFTKDSEVYYNVAYNNGEAGIRVDRLVHGNKIYNNVLYNNLYGIYVMSTEETQSEAGITNNIFKNNIAVGNTWQLLATDGGENDGVYGYGNIYENNFFGIEGESFIGWGGDAWNPTPYSTYDAWEESYGSSTHSVEADPLFTDAPNNNFTLLSTSPAIDAGTDVGLILDYLGTLVPLGGGVDIGAYEYNDTVNPTITFSCSPTSVNVGQVITCSCSATDDVDLSPSVSYTVNPSTSSTGTYTTTCTATDNSGNSASSSISYTVSSSGGGGTPSFYTNTIVQDDKEFSEIESITSELKKKERIRIKINDTKHYVGVAELTNTTATIEIFSTSQKTVFNIGDENKFDVTDDNYYDIYVKLNSIAENKANLTIKSIYEEIPLEEKKPEEKIEEKLKSWLLILGLVIITLVVAVIVRYKKRRKK